MKKLRHAMIVELIEKEVIETQEELADRLKKAGFDVTQATVSRDIRDLKLSKVTLDNGKQKYVLIKEKNNAAKKYIRVLQEGFVSMDMAQNILVIKTMPGLAMAVAAALDELNIEGMLGCIAGDDTIMCAIKDVTLTYDVMTRLSDMLEK
jgi:arginine repressor